LRSAQRRGSTFDTGRYGRADVIDTERQSSLETMMRCAFPFVGAISAVLIGASAQPASAAPDDAIYLRPGRLVEADGARLNLYCTGSGSPTVVFDAGHQDWAPAWAVVQPEVAKWARACSFDRPGYGFSPPSPLPRTSERIATELHDALHKLGITGPYVLVGHAFGATNVRAFAFLYPGETQGLVLIDPDPIDAGTPEQVARAHSVYIEQAIEIERCRDALAAHQPQPPELSCDKRFFRGFPEPGWSEALNTALSDAVHTRPDLSEAANAELTQIPADELWLRVHRTSLGSRPVRVITAAQHKPDTIAAQAALLSVSSDGKQILAAHSRNAYAQFDEPQLVIDAIAEAAGRRSPQQSSSSTERGR
jgi:pimeloyl-ACP methyl ester carboxylesterase